MAGKFEVYQDKAGKYRWSLKARNGQVVASGQGYDTKAAAIRGTQAVQRAAEGATLHDPDTKTSAAKSAEGSSRPRAWPKKWSGSYRKSESGRPRAEKASAARSTAREKSAPTTKNAKDRKLIKIEETGASQPDANS